MLRFSPILELNDPFECRSSFKYVCSPELLESIINDIKQGKRNNQNWRPGQDIFDVFDKMWDPQNIVLSEQRIREANHKLVDEIRLHNEKANHIQDIGILSLSSNNDNPTMWAHYSSEHSGFVLGFDTSHGFFEDDLEYDSEEIEPGEYVHSVIGINRSGPAQVEYRQNWAVDFAYNLGALGCYWDFTHVKSKSWEYEDEWRMIEYGIQSSNRYGILGLVDCPEEAIKTIYLGLNAGEHLKAVTKAFRKRNPHVSIMEAYLDTMSYKVLFRPFN